MLIIMAKEKSPIEKTTFEKWINDGVIKGV